MSVPKEECEMPFANEALTDDAICIERRYVYEEEQVDSRALRALDAIVQSKPNQCPIVCEMQAAKAASAFFVRLRADSA
jgi:hypothetical protein